MISTADPVLIFDLDGTIIDVNSFPIWVEQMLFGRIPAIGPGRRALVALRCATALAHRKILRLGHAEFKTRLQTIWAGAMAGYADGDLCGGLTDRLAIHVRPNLHTILREVSEERVDAILTTAAAAEYAIPLARRLGFRHAIATPSAGSADRTENVGAAKRDRTLAYLEARGWADRPRIFFTDHRDDLPLIRECQTIIWLGPDVERADVCDHAIAARSLAAEATYAHALGWREPSATAAGTPREVSACT